MMNMLFRESVPDAWRSWKKLTKDGLDAQFDGQYGLAERRLRSALEKAKRFGESCPLLGQSLGNLARCYLFVGDYRKAETLLSQAVAFFENVGTGGSLELAEALGELSAVYFGTERAMVARRLRMRCMAILENQPWTSETAESIARIGKAMSKVGRFEQAEELYMRALLIAKDAGDKGLAGRISDSLNYVCTRQGNMADARQWSNVSAGMEFAAGAGLATA
jgi:tetratricopeptide (TPR) repeat protein